MRKSLLAFGLLLVSTAALAAHGGHDGGGDNHFAGHGFGGDHGIHRGLGLDRGHRDFPRAAPRVERFHDGGGLRPDRDRGRVDVGRGRHFWHGQWYEYGVGPCWVYVDGVWFWNDLVCPL